MTTPTPSVGAAVAVHGRKSLEAVRVCACRSCQAPGVWRAPKNVEEIKHYAKWPGCLVELGDLRDGTPVGETCPNCGASRAGLLQKLGEIWHRYY